MNNPYQLVLGLTMAGYLALGSAPSFGLSPEEVFEKASPSIVVVETFSNRATPIALGSGVTVRSGTVITNCHVLAQGDKFLVLDRQARLPARLIDGDANRDLCVLSVEGLRARPVEFGDPRSAKPGARVYAIGSPQGLELTISDGLISGLRAIQGSAVIQTSAPISGGSSGGGLFDTSGRLIGITWASLTESQNLNFALPVDWVTQLLNGYSSVQSTVRALQAPIAYRDHFISEEWLAAMSERLAKYISDPSYRIELLKTLHYEATRAGLDPQLALALIQALSGFTKYAVSPSGARGLMQVMPTWISRIGTPDQNLFHLRTNLRYGCAIFRHYVNTNNGDLLKAVTAYHNQALGRPEGYPAETDAFAKEVYKLWRTQWRYDRKSQ